jgi:hypothetical protein
MLACLRWALLIVILNGLARRGVASRLLGVVGKKLMVPSMILLYTK